MNESIDLTAINNSLVILNRLSALKFFFTHLNPHRLYRALPLLWGPRCWGFDCSWKSGKYLVWIDRHLETVNMSTRDLNRHASKMSRVVSSYMSIAWIALAIADMVETTRMEGFNPGWRCDLPEWVSEHCWEGTATIHVWDDKVQPYTVKSTLKGKEMAIIIV